VKRIRSLRPSTGASVVAALVVIAAIGFVLLQTIGGSSELSVSSLEEPTITKSEFASIAVGASRERIESRQGKGEDALDFVAFGNTGSALEPLDASCVYFNVGPYNTAALVQLCFSDGKLTSKRRFP
jgi:hypothetical protein